MPTLKKLVLDGFDGVIEYSVADTKVIVYNHTCKDAFCKYGYCHGSLKILELHIIQHVEDLSLTFVGTEVLWSGMEIANEA